MRIALGTLFSVLVLTTSSPASAFGLSDCVPLPSGLAEESRIEHLYGGSPDGTEPIARRAYVFAFDSAHNVPKWAAWYAAKQYRDTPKREKRWSAFRKDADVSPITSDDYIGWFDSQENFARGHIVPYFISGGDRDGDGKDAEFESNLKVEDKDDACTVYEINAMSNIAPQYHDAFNGRPGVWWQLETDIRGLVDNGSEFQVFAGTVFLQDENVEMIGDRDLDPSKWDIGVPHGFFKVVDDVDRREAVGFLFDHAGDLKHGCDIRDRVNVNWPSDCIVAIDRIEAATGLEFFPNLANRRDQALRAASTKETWLEWLDIGE